MDHHIGATVQSSDVGMAEVLRVIASSPVQAHEPIIIRIQDCHVLRSGPVEKSAQLKEIAKGLRTR